MGEMIAFVICYIMLLRCQQWIRSIPAATVPTSTSYFGRVGSIWFSIKKKRQVDLTRTAVLQACCTKAMLRHAYIAQGPFCFGKAPSESTNRLPNPLVWHLLGVGWATKGDR